MLTRDYIAVTVAQGAAIVPSEPSSTVLTDHFRVNLLDLYCPLYFWLPPSLKIPSAQGVTPSGLGIMLWNEASRWNQM